jgi:arsenate reductase
MLGAMALPSGDDEIVILHNPRCTKSRAALALLQASGLRFTERRYLEDPLDAKELRELASRLDRPPREWLRKREAAEAGVDPGADDKQLLAAMAAHPAVIERPIVVRGRRAVVGRPPEAIESLL